MRTYKFKRNNEIIRATGQSESQVRKRLNLCFVPEVHLFFHVDSSHLVHYLLTFVGITAVKRSKFIGNFDRISRETNKPLATYFEEVGHNKLWKE